MLKAMHSALLDEVIRSNDYIQGQNFTNLYNFVTLLADHFPSLTFANSPSLRRAKRAVASTVTLSFQCAMFLDSKEKRASQARLLALETVLGPEAGICFGTRMAEPIRKRRTGLRPSVSRKCDMATGSC